MSPFRQSPLKLKLSTSNHQTMTASCSPAFANRMAVLGVFVLFAAMFAVPSGYSYGGIFLLLGALVFLAQRPDLSSLDNEDRIMVAVLLAYAVVPSLMTWLLGNNPTDYDQYSRALLATPIFLMLCLVRVPLRVLWLGTIVGITLSAPLAWWQVRIDDWARAPGFLNIIHFSNLSLVFTLFCVAGLFWAPTQGRLAKRWCAAFLLAIACGLYSVIMGGSRGSWVALPPVILLFLIAFLTPRNARYFALVFLAGAILIAGLFIMPNSPLKARY
ncbi:MAG: hypothetical protein L0H54_10245, partial [Alcaligenaceae bacterium]|nr:hypothetical protein [Alcaligenaceae bacterium]